MNDPIALWAIAGAGIGLAAYIRHREIVRRLAALAFTALSAILFVLSISSRTTGEAQSGIDVLVVLFIVLASARLSIAAIVARRHPAPRAIEDEPGALGAVDRAAESEGSTS
jgi:hypothetical protein